MNRTGTADTRPGTGENQGLISKFVYDPLYSYTTQLDEQRGFSVSFFVTFVVNLVAPLVALGLSAKGKGDQIATIRASWAVVLTGSLIGIVIGAIRLRSTKTSGRYVLSIAVHALITCLMAAGLVMSARVLASMLCQEIGDQCGARVLVVVGSTFATIYSLGVVVTEIVIKKAKPDDLN